MKVGFLTLGCKVNQYETEAMKEKFLGRGYDIAEKNETADIYVINTCTVTNLADRKSRQYIRRAKNDNPDSLVVVTGCYAQMDPEAVSEIPGVNLIAGTNEKQNIVDYIEKELMVSSTISDVPCHIRAYEEIKDYISDGIITAMDSRTRAYVKIQEGCNRFCTYCIIPYARGRIRSRSESEIIEEVRGLVSSGFKEIVLTGINTALYGAEDGEFALGRLLSKLDDMEGDFRVRLSSLEPTVVTKNDVNGILNSKRLCHHLHLSVQSGSDKILKLMGRRYSKRDYLDIVEILRSFDPGYGITTDIIVGFPGEEEDDFLSSVDVIRKGFLSKVHGFRYSPRKGTKAEAMENQVSGEEKSRRIKILTSEANSISHEFMDSISGRVERVLFEEKSGKELRGYSDNYIRVYVRFDEGYINEFAYVKLLKPYKDGMKGEIVDEKGESNG